MSAQSKTDRIAPIQKLFDEGRFHYDPSVRLELMFGDRPLRDGLDAAQRATSLLAERLGVPIVSASEDFDPRTYSPIVGLDTP